MGNSKSSESPDDSKEETMQNDSSKKSKMRSLKKPLGSARSSVSSQGNKRPLLTANQRAIIKYCLDNAKEDIAERILRRGYEKRDDFRLFIENLGRQQRIDLIESLKEFLLGVCDNLMDCEEIQRMSETFGASYTQHRALGFKPDFFACTADGVTTECTFLDQATHTPSETAGAWSMLTAFAFSAVRDGYYTELRRQRKAATGAFKNRASFDVSTDGSGGDQSSRRSASPPAEDETQEDHQQQQHKDHQKDNNTNNTNFLLPPQVY